MKRRNLFLALAAVCVFAATSARAQVLKLTQTVVNDQRRKLIEQVSLKGDVRLRHETINKKSPGNVARQRQRFRFRLQGDVNLPEYWSLGIRLVSGAGEQVSPNQSFDNLGSGKGIQIDRLFVKWSPFLSEDGKLEMTAGKIGNPLWRPYSADAVWDPDFSPEGAAQKIEWFIAPLGGIYFFNALQMAVDEDSSSTADQALFSNQIGAEYKMPFDTRLRLAGSWNEWVNERFSTFGQVATGEGNRRVAGGPGTGALANEFSVLELSAQVTAWPMGRQVRMQGTYLKNTGHVSLRENASDFHREDQGYQVGAIIGEAKLPKSWEAAYFYKWVETDATVADLTDSDFGDGGTNRRGHIAWLGYSPRDWMQVKVKYFYTRVINAALAPGLDDINRTQLDLVLKF